MMIKKLNILYIEDEIEFRERLLSRMEPKLNILPLPLEAFNTEVEQGETGEQFERWLLSNIPNVDELHGVVLDSDLSGYRNGISKETLLAVFRGLGVPVCRYSKRPRSSSSELLKHYATLASEGASSVLVPSELVAGKNGFAEDDELADWLAITFAGFSTISTKYSAYLAVNPDHKASPQAVLAGLLDRPSIELDFQGYTGASLFFFGDRFTGSEAIDTPAVRSHYARITATKFGYWLFNYILAFPGPILSVAATAAFLGIESDEVDSLQLVNALRGQSYEGPFSGCQPMFWRESLEEMLLAGSTGVDVLEGAGLNVKPLYPADPSRSGALCIVSKRSLPMEACVGPLDWIPSGASDLCRVDRTLYARLTPWLNL